MNESKGESAIIMLERIAQKLTGELPETLRMQTISERREQVQAKHNKPMSFVSHFPFIGRGNVMSDRIISHETVEGLLCNALRD